jgi:hypothetical protein
MQGVMAGRDESRASTPSNTDRELHIPRPRGLYTLPWDSSKRRDSFFMSASLMKKARDKLMRFDAALRVVSAAFMDRINRHAVLQKLRFLHKEYRSEPCILLVSYRHMLA